MAQARAAGQTPVQNHMFLARAHAAGVQGHRRYHMFTTLDGNSKDGGIRRFAMGSLIVALCILTVYILQQMGIIPMNPF